MKMFLVSIGFLAAVLPACSSDVSASDATSAYAGAYCDRLAECAPNKIRTIYVDVAACKERVSLQIEPTFGLNGSNASTENMSDCGGGLRGLSCDDFLARKYPDSCRIPAGALPEGTPCGDSAQCAGRYCRKARNSGCGTCSNLSGPSETCENDAACDVGLACIENSCAPLSKKGESCVNRPCTLAMACIDGVCAEPLAAGEKCPEPPAENACAEGKGFFCNSATTCVELKTVGTGETCGYVGGESVGCSGGGTCVTGANPHQGVCKPAAVDGAPCDATKGPFCRPGAHCVGDVCKVDVPSSCK